MRIVTNNRGFFDPGWTLEIPVLIIEIILFFVGSFFLKRGILVGAVPCCIVGAGLFLYWSYVLILDCRSSGYVDVERLQPCPRCGSSLTPLAWREEKEEPALLCKCEKCLVCFNVTNYETPIVD